MSTFIAIARLLFSSLLVVLPACGTSGTSYSNRIADNGHDVLYSRAQAKDGSARFECRASDSGACHYTLFPEACAGQRDCRLAPLRRFAVARGGNRQVDGLEAFRVCVSTDAAALGADCQPALARAD
jgi:hypothetical protein